MSTQFNATTACDEILQRFAEAREEQRTTTSPQATRVNTAATAQRALASTNRVPSTQVIAAPSPAAASTSPQVTAPAATTTRTPPPVVTPSTHTNTTILSSLGLAGIGTEFFRRYVSSNKPLLSSQRKCEMAASVIPFMLGFTLLKMKPRSVENLVEDAKSIPSKVQRGFAATKKYIKDNKDTVYALAIAGLALGWAISSIIKSSVPVQQIENTQPKEDPVASPAEDNLSRLLEQNILIPSKEPSNSPPELTNPEVVKEAEIIPAAPLTVAAPSQDDVSLRDISFTTAKVVDAYLNPIGFAQRNVLPPIMAALKESAVKFMYAARTFQRGA